MTKPRRPKPPPAEALFAVKRAKPAPFPFVLEALEPLGPTTRPMFGCLAVYVEDRIVLALRDKPEPAQDNGVWLATSAEHHASLREELPSLRSISVLGAGVTGWQVLPSESPDFEDEVLRAMDLIRGGDPRIGKVPKGKRPSARGRKAP